MARAEHNYFGYDADWRFETMIRGAAFDGDEGPSLAQGVERACHRAELAVTFHRFRL